MAGPAPTGTGRRERARAFSGCKNSLERNIPDGADRFFKTVGAVGSGVWRQQAISTGTRPS